MFVAEKALLLLVIFLTVLWIEAQLIGKQCKKYHQTHTYTHLYDQFRELNDKKYIIHVYL